MTLKQAFTLWANESANISLAARSRDAVQKVLMKKYNDVELVQFTASTAERIFKQSKEAQELKVKAASVLVHVLNYGAVKGWCSKPTFTYEIASPMKKISGAVGDTVADFDPVADTPRRAMASEAQPSDTVGTVPAVAKGEDDITEGLSPSVSDSESGKPDYCDGCNNVKGCITCVDGDQRAVISEVKPKDDDMKPKKERKPAGRKARPLAQIHPDTLEVVKVWPSLSEAERETGACNLDRVITLLRKSVGFYWCNAEDVDTFKARLDEKKQKTAERQKQHAASMREIKAAMEREQSRPKTKAAIPNKVTNNFRAIIKDDGPATPVESAAVLQQSSAAEAALAVFTDAELIAELDRRGWQGELCRTQVVSIGKNNDCKK